ncbi:hypothetical protein ACF1AO_09140 [Streptomyces longwoodensis]|uniref:hypothetical protein n=1 Tax=Streptomyces longwoodensis TaxID=68231 RepID=UPI0036FE2234
MPADEVTHGTEVDVSRERTGPRHAAPKKPLFTRFHVPAGKAIALAAMPTAVLMGMGFTPTLANADDQPASKSLTVDEYKDCVAALTGASPSASPSPSASASESPSADSQDGKDGSAGSQDGSDTSAGSASGASGSSGTSGSSDSGSDDTAAPRPSATSEAPKTTEKSSTGSTGSSSGTSGAAAASPSPSATQNDGNLLDTIGDALGGLLTGGSHSSSTATPSPSETSPASGGGSGDTTSGSTGSSGAASSSGSSGSSGSAGTSGSSGSGSSAGSSTGKGSVKDTTDAVTDKVKDAAKDAKDAKDKKDATDSPSPSSSASPSESASADAQDCPAATDDEGGVDNKLLVPDDPWYLEASSLLLKGADYQGVVEVRTANGTKKKALKYVISGGTDIGDLHQLVKDKQSGKTYHVQAGKGTTSTIRDGDTVMYTESISGNLFGLIPVTFTPDSPPPLNIPLIYFTNVKVTQAGQFGGTLHIPGLHQYATG